MCLPQLFRNQTDLGSIVPADREVAMLTESLRAVIAAAMLSALVIGRYAVAAQNTPDVRSAGPASSAESGVQSGVYGFSGALKGGSSLSGVIGECIWIYDSDNRKQIAKGDCDQGNFRVPLQPGQYVVRGPGGNQKVDVKPHQWVKIRSLVTLPGNL
jgi:hypothetical protein